ncbi:hypothetical protein NPX13_g5533 [Xylaria arbuscula]|uniref:RelA/SpoT domain-containing protein n=1 Tax=Xylaria arbuscula TaxID=114810 RepID=A0A9W8TMM0_9PEZI|nr:hypothetical protein NPX13_g5533 [Xylaria arbuscula]
MAMGPEESFRKLLEDFEAIYDPRAALIEKKMNAIYNMLPRALKEYDIKYHEPIAKRVKERESAKGSLERRYKARMELSELKQRLLNASNREDAWETFWKRNGKAFSVDDIGPFPDCDSMFHSLHDIGGMRILLYFPGQITRVVKALESLDGIKVIKQFEHGGPISPDMAELKQHVEILENKPDSWETKKNKIFAGYRATHIHISPKDDTNCVIEIQVATVVMNAWAQVEHDIIYKHTGTNPDKKIMRILDTFNGIVMVGENALRELEEIKQQLEEDQENASKTIARDIYQLGQWITSYSHENNHPLLKSGKQPLKYLGNLFDILAIKQQHTLKDVKELITCYLETKPSETPLDQNLPLYLLLQEFRDKTRLDIPNSTNQTERREARFLAKRVTESLNIAAYLGVLDEFVSVMEPTLPKERPSMIDFLDILHPQTPMASYYKRHPQDPNETKAGDEKLTEFCKEFLNHHGLKRVLQSSRQLFPPVTALVELTLLLALSGWVAEPEPSLYPPDTDTGRQLKSVVISRELCALLDDRNCHLIPELCLQAESMKETQHQSGPPLSNRFNHITEQIPWVFNMPRTEGDTSLDMRNTIFTFEEKIGSMWFKIKYGGTRPSEWLSMRVDNRGTEERRLMPEYHAEKSTRGHRSARGKHPGIFVSRSNIEGKARPQWDYNSESPRAWAIRGVVDTDDELNIARRGHRESEFLDIGNSLTLVERLVHKETKGDGCVVYELKVGGVDFHLLSQQDDYVLHKSTFHDNVPSGSRTDDLVDVDTDTAMEDSVEERENYYDAPTSPLGGENLAGGNVTGGDTAVTDVSQDEEENMPVDNGEN